MADNAPGSITSTDASTVGPSAVDLAGNLSGQNPNTPPTAAPGAPTGPVYLGYERHPASVLDPAHPPLYTVALADEVLQNLPESEWLAVKRRMLQAGFYGSVDPNKVDMSARRTAADVKAWEALLSEANINGRTTWELALRDRETDPGIPPPSSTVDPKQVSDLVDAGLNIEQQLRQFGQANGLDVTSKQARHWGQQILAGTSSVEQVLDTWRRKYVAGAYPAWRDEILAGQDVADIAAPYTQKLEDMLGLPPGSVGANDPLVRKALQGVGADGKAAIVPLYQFEYEVRKDNRWASSVNGMNETADMLDSAYNQMMGMF